MASYDNRQPPRPTLMWLEEAIDEILGLARAIIVRLMADIRNTLRRWFPKRS